MIDLERSIIKISGSDIHSFLQGLTTQDINKLNEFGISYSFMLNAQGRFMYDFFLHYQSQNTIYIDINHNFTDSFISKLKFYKLKNDVNIELCQNLYINLEENFWQNFKGGAISRSITENKNLPKINVIDNNFNRIVNNIPDGYYDLEQAKSIILEFGAEELNAIDFDKGCYVGQELMTRTKRLGQIRKKIFTITGSNQFPPKYTKIMQNNAEVGILLSSCQNLALAQLKFELLSGKQLTISDSNYEICNP